MHKCRTCLNEHSRWSWGSVHQQDMHTGVGKDFINSLLTNPFVDQLNILQPRYLGSSSEGSDAEVPDGDQCPASQVKNSAEVVHRYQRVAYGQSPQRGVIFVIAVAKNDRTPNGLQIIGRSQQEGLRRRALRAD